MVSATPAPERPTSPVVRILCCAVVAGLVLAANWLILDFDWLLFDDDINILTNPHLGRGAASSLAWAFQDFDYIRRYLPLGWVGFYALLGIDGYNATVFHTASWLLMAINAVLAFLVFERLLLSRTQPVAGAGAATLRIVVAAAIAALAWSLHPLRAENAAWISGLLYLGGATFALTAVLLHLQSLAGGTNERARRLGGALCYLASLLVYPVFLALPAVLLWRGLCIAPQRMRAFREEFRRLTGWWLATGFALGLNLFARIHASDTFAAPNEFAPGGVGERGLVAIRATLHYVARTVWPGEVSPFYGLADQLLKPSGQRIALCVVGVAAIVLLALKSTRRPTLAWSLAGLISLLPFLGQLGYDFHANDRYAILWLAIWAAAAAMWLAQLQAKPWRLAVAGVGLLLLGLDYGRALPNWENTRTLQAKIDAVTAARPHPKMSFSRRALALWWLGETEESARCLREGLARFPASPSLAAAKTLLEEIDPAWRQRVGNRKGIPPLAMLHYDLGRTWQQRAQLPAARAHYLRALALAPTFDEARSAYEKLTLAATAGKP
jgi:tetratricopeptide (TPR) repeat protein